MGFVFKCFRNEYRVWDKLLYSYYHHHHLTAIFQVNLDRIFFVHLLQYRNYGISSTGL